ncbi:hypothetical protein KIN20_005044, partial [Parelaphostrongylus tenuis]
MEKAVVIDSTSQENDDSVRLISRILDDLFKSYSQHTDFITSVLFCVHTLIRSPSCSDEGKAVIKKAVDRLAEVCTKALWTQLQTLDAIRRLNAPEVAILLANAFRGLRNGVTIPVRLLLNDRLLRMSNTELLLPSYAMAMGENSSFTLGIPSDGPVWEPRKVPLEGVRKVSMSTNHALFLTNEGEVFACGATANFDTGEDNGKLVVSPVQIRFSGETSPIVDIAAGPHHSIFITKKSVYVCGMNTNFCLGMKKDKCHYTMKNLKLPVTGGAKNAELEEVFTNADFTLIRSSGNQDQEDRFIWIVGKTPTKVEETFKLIDLRREIGYAMIHRDITRIGMNNELAILHHDTGLYISPVAYTLVNYSSRGLKDVKVTITNNSGVLNYTFDPHYGSLPLEPCVVSINGFLVDICCVDYHITTKGDVFLMGQLSCCKWDFCTLYRGKVVVVEDKVIDDGFIEAYSKESKFCGLRILLLLQEVPGAQIVSSFSCSPDGKNLIYVTNSSISHRNEQWRTADHEKLNRMRETECLDKLDLNFYIFDEDDVCSCTLEVIIRARFPNIDKYLKMGNSIWIRDLTEQVGNVICSRIFRDYLVYNENRVVKNDVFTESIVGNVCRVLGVPFIVKEQFYQIGEPLQSLEDFMALHNCILVSEEGVEIKFVREILELQSSYFTIALSYLNSDSFPRLHLYASERMIRHTLLGIINQNYFRCLQLHELVELVQFLDQYLLRAVIADVLRVIFEQVNEFNIGIIFNLYEIVPPVRSLLAEYLFHNLHLVCLWKNSASASTDLLRSVFACDESSTCEDIRYTTFDPYFALEPISIHVLGEYRKVHWSLFRTEDVLDVMIGSGIRDTAMELAVRRFLQDSGADHDYTVENFENSHEPGLVTMIRKRITVRDQANTSRRDRRKTSLQSVSDTDGKTVEEFTTSPDLPLMSHDSEIQEESILETTEDDLDRQQSRLIEPIIIDDKGEPTSPATQSPMDLCESSDATSSVSVSHKKVRAGRFTPKGVKFRDANHLLMDTQSPSDTHFAPWAETTTSSNNSDLPSMHQILQEEMDKHAKEAISISASCLKEKTKSNQRKSSMSWNETLMASSPTSPPVPSLHQIMDEEERRLQKGNCNPSRPLQFIQDEERAIEELTQLYRENLGDECIVRVERCTTSGVTEPNPVAVLSAGQPSRIFNEAATEMAYYGNHLRGRSKNQDNFDRDRDEPNGFKNPQYGPNVQLIDPNWERKVLAKLDEFLNGTATELYFPPMERPERRRLHELARRKNLLTQSEGREPNRRCIVYRRPVAKLAAVGANETQPIRLTPNVREALSKFIQQYPINISAIDSHLVVHKRKDHSQRDNGNRERQEMLVPQRSNSSSEMQRQRNKLPAYQQREHVLRAINEHKVVLITGGTGCGKTTQVPQFLLEHAYENQQPLRIVCTQPRRLPAIAVASRVARERGEALGSTVGYHIRLEQRTSPQTVLTYCTSGVLLRMLTQDDAASDISHIILDEIHEREQNTDYLLIALKQALKKRNDLKVILMSATMEGNLMLFTKYFGEKVEVKHINIPSRLYNVERFFLGDVIAMTGFVPEENMFSSMFMSTEFQEVCSFPTIGDWSTKAKWESEIPKSHAGLPENMTAPNLTSLGGNGCAAPSSTSVVGGHMMTSLSVTSFAQHAKQQQQHSANFMNVAQQLVNSQQSSTQHQPHSSMSSQPQTIHQSQQQQPQSSYSQPQNAIYLQHVAYDQGYEQQPHGYQQGGASRQVYAQHSGGIALQHSATWAGGLDQSYTSVGHAHPDVVDLPNEALDPETLEQFRQMGFTNNEEMGPTYGTEWRVVEGDAHPPWQHSQSYPAPNATYQQGVLQTWESQVLYSSQPTQTYRKTQQPVFYVPESYDNSPSTKSVSYYGHSMDGYPVQLHSHNTLQGSGNSTSNYPHAHQAPSGSHPPPRAGYQQLGAPQPPVDTYASAVQRSEKELEIMRHQLGTALPERPSSFDPRVRQLLLARRLDQSSLVNMYMKCGGQQWAESVDLDLAMAVVKYCMDSQIDGALLVFLPGFDDIIQMRDKIISEPWCRRQPVIFTLHSQMNSFDQQKVFDSVGHNERKVILSTNIAEASLTIDDVVFVIDCGKVKEKTYDHTSRISQLKVTWIAKSNAEQRAGRAGRCREGFCFRLYSVEDYDVMLPTQMAEMQRTAIHDVCLHAKMFAPDNMTVKQFLQMAPEPPLADSVDKSMAFLEQLGALYSEESTSDTDISTTPAVYVEPHLTDLGKLVAQLPLDPQLARLLLFGVVLKCLNPVVTLVAALSYRDPFILALSEEREQSNRQRDSFGKRDFSDHITLIRAFNEFNEKSPKEAAVFCRTNYLSLPAMKMIAGIRRQLLIELCRVRMISNDGDVMNALRETAYNQYSSSWQMVQAAIVAGCYPGIGFVRAGNKLKKIRTSTEAVATLHPSSVIKRQVLSASKRSEVINQYVTEDSEDPTIEYLAFHELAKIDEGLTLRTVTVVPPCAVVLFAGSIRLKKSTMQYFNITDPNSGDEDEVEDEGERDVVHAIEHWIGVRATYSDMKRLIQLRFKVMSYFHAVIHKPHLLTIPQKEHSDLLATLELVLRTDHREMKFNDCTLPQFSPIHEQHQLPTTSSTSSFSSQNGQQNNLQRVTQRDGPTSEANVNAVAESNQKSVPLASHPNTISSSQSATNFHNACLEERLVSEDRPLPSSAQHDKEQHDRNQRQQPRRYVGNHDDNGYQKGRRSNHDVRRFSNRNRDDWQRCRPYQSRDSYRDKRALNFRDVDRDRSGRDEATAGPSSYQPRQRIQ